MKRPSLSLPEIFYTLSFLIYLLGSSLTLISHGQELSLWLMFLAVLIAASTTILPWVGIRWIRLDNQGSRAGWWVSFLLQITSWGTFAVAMLMRLGRNFPSFYFWVVTTTMLWAIWLLVLIFSRHVWRIPKINVTQNHPSEKEGSAL